MHPRLRQKGECAPGTIRSRANRSLHALALTGLLLVTTIASLLTPGLVYASGTAPNGPGSSSNWAPATNSIVGTAANTTSDVWFTGYSVKHKKELEAC